MIESWWRKFTLMDGKYSTCSVDCACWDSPNALRDQEKYARAPSSLLKKMCVDTTESLSLDTDFRIRSCPPLHFALHKAYWKVLLRTEADQSSSGPMSEKEKETSLPAMLPASSDDDSDDEEEEESSMSCYRILVMSFRKQGSCLGWIPQFWLSQELVFDGILYACFYQ
jgi:hypothetical protein